MRGKTVKHLILWISLLGLAHSAAFAANFPDNGRIPPALPAAPKPTPENTSPPPFPRTYLEEAAESLGVRNGHLDLFSSHPAADNPFMPTVSGSVGGNGAMLKLQWHPGE